MHRHHYPGLDSPQLVWTYGRQDKVTRVVARQPEYSAARYDELIHPHDAPFVLRAIRRHFKLQKRQHRRSGQFVNLHRVRNAQGYYCHHSALITLTRDTSDRLAFVVGVDYLARAGAHSGDSALNQCVDGMTTPPSPVTSQVAYGAVDLRRRSDRTGDPFAQTWRCAGYIVSPALFRMIRIDDGITIELSEKQARFISLLLGATDITGAPVYVERARTRRYVFEADADSRLYDNDIDRLVQFYRQCFGPAAIRTKRGYGHILRADHDLCVQADAPRIVASAP